ARPQPKVAPSGPRAKARPKPRTRHATPPRRRLIAMLVAITLCFVALAARLTYVQGVASKRYAAISESQRLHTEPRPGARGAIFDRNGRELALSVRQSTIWANPRLVNDP